MSDLSDLAFFARLVQCGSLSAAARTLGVTPPAISRRLAALEQRLGVRLLHRTTRTLALTEEGERYLGRGQRILDDLAELENDVSGGSLAPRGLLRVNATLGFGRRHIAPLISGFIHAFPQTEVQLQLTDRLPALTSGAFDVSIRVGEPPDTRLVSRHLLNNIRLLCAAPDYLARHPLIEQPADLTRHQCIVIRENEDVFGNWQLYSGQRQTMVKVSGALSTNDGETAVNWGLAGHGVMLRSCWDITPYLQTGQLVRILPDWQGAPADIWALYPRLRQPSARVRAFIDFLSQHLSGATAQA
ncbi:LysR family transcriptional regulator [uncultured Aquitalea sp.]|uniref:LysR family transcriptional regulator n=1 Tax=uncultured Aquitalea sp. TaxID=540272 RepID=UPI0025DCE208|nr:LysR family transcriptional regulator [uncultured Aquitalea sp.]